MNINRKCSGVSTIKGSTYIFHKGQMVVTTFKTLEKFNLIQGQEVCRVVQIAIFIYDMNIPEEPHNDISTIKVSQRVITDKSGGL